jgi:hypothetical protein
VGGGYDDGDGLEDGLRLGGSVALMSKRNFGRLSARAGGCGPIKPPVSVWSGTSG